VQPASSAAQLSPRFVGESANAGHGKRILLIPAPGERTRSA
jgi:hypothetical protein